MDIAAKIKAVRLAKKAADNGHDWTQAACALRAGMTQSQWADLEAGRRMPRLDTLERIAAGLGCPLAELVS